MFHNNSGSGEGAAFYYADGVTSNSNLYQTIIQLTGVNFTANKAVDSVAYIVGNSINNTQIKVQDASTYFINNMGTALHISMCVVEFHFYVLFENNTANIGGALYLEQGTQIYFEYGSNNVLLFVNNIATQYGGAIYIDLPCIRTTDSITFHSYAGEIFNISFINNKSVITGNSIYFNIHENCKIDTNASSVDSLLHYPYKFHYTEPLGKSIVTSPHSLILYFPDHDGSYIGNKTFFICNKILRKAITFTGNVLDYCNNSAQPTQFYVKCVNGCGGYTLADDRLLVDNASLLSITVYGHRIVRPLNITLELTSLLASFNQQFLMQLIIELQQCFSGYYYNVNYNQCVCYSYKDIVQCYDDYIEIKRGYWFGTVSGTFKPTVSLCPSQYCDFGKHRKETRQGYCIIPSKLDDQCSSHRTGVACGECKSGYTLAYDSPDCINTDKCSAGMTILVIVLTILYWIAIVAVVFGLMYFQFQISSGYAYGIIYYYSIVDILLVNIHMFQMHCFK